MLGNISWSDFILFIVLFLSSYYLYIIAVFFRRDLFGLFGNHPKKQGLNSQATPSSLKPKPLNTHGNSSIENVQSETPLSVIHELVEDLKKLFALAAKTKMVKEELLQAIHSNLESYPQIAGTDLQHDVNIHIRVEVEEQCSIDLSPEDIKRIWQP